MEDLFDDDTSEFLDVHLPHGLSVAKGSVFRRPCRISGEGSSRSTLKSPFGSFYCFNTTHFSELTILGSVEAYKSARVTLQRCAIIDKCESFNSSILIFCCSLYSRSLPALGCDDLSSHVNDSSHVIAFRSRIAGVLSTGANLPKQLLLRRCIIGAFPKEFEDVDPRRETSGWTGRSEIVATGNSAIRLESSKPQK